MAKKYGKTSAREKLRRIILATETHCYLCNLPVDKTLPPNHPAAAQVEDVIPVSKGGNPLDRNNLRLAHRSCNLRKSDKSLAFYQESTKRFEVSRKW